MTSLFIISEYDLKWHIFLYKRGHYKITICLLNLICVQVSLQGVALVWNCNIETMNYLCVTVKHSQKTK